MSNSSIRLETNKAKHDDFEHVMKDYNDTNHQGNKPMTRKGNKKSDENCCNTTNINGSYIAFCLSRKGCLVSLRLIAEELLGQMKPLLSIIMAKFSSKEAANH